MRRLSRAVVVAVLLTLAAGEEARANEPVDAPVPAQAGDHLAGVISGSGGFHGPYDTYPDATLSLSGVYGGTEVAASLSCASTNGWVYSNTATCTSQPVSDGVTSLPDLSMTYTFGYSYAATIPFVCSYQCQQPYREGRFRLDAQVLDGRSMSCSGHFEQDQFRGEGTISSYRFEGPCTIS